MICKFRRELLDLWTDNMPAPWADDIDGVEVEFPDDARDTYCGEYGVYGVLRCWCEPLTKETEEKLAVKQKEPERCPKCGCNVFVSKHKGPHVGWYCNRCGRWIRWIPQHGKKAVLTEHSPVELPEDRTHNDTSPLSDEERTEAYFGKLPWE